MHDECVVAVFHDLEQAKTAVHILDRGEFPTDQVSFVTKSPKELPEVREDFKMRDDSLRDAMIGAGLGAIAGGLSGAVVMMVSGVGAVFLAGPIGLGLTGAVAGAFLGSMGGWGVHKERIRHYEKLVQQGKVLVIAHGDPIQLVHADRILKETDAEQVHLYSKTSSEAPEVLE